MHGAERIKAVGLLHKVQSWLPLSHWNDWQNVVTCHCSNTTLNYALITRSWESPLLSEPPYARPACTVVWEAYLTSIHGRGVYSIRRCYYQVFKCGIVNTTMVFSELLLVICCIRSLTIWVSRKKYLSYDSFLKCIISSIIVWIILFFQSENVQILFRTFLC